ncbi:hypothetical protein TUMSATVNIG2_55820 (plasmid) [Vibrio nigripulchritudo]|nr:hypothetical protein TUMSATVNIG2_55820 [Vibrio nigripulchritudo]
MTHDYRIHNHTNINLSHFGESINSKSKYREMPTKTMRNEGRLTARETQIYVFRIARILPS